MAFTPSKGAVISVGVDGAAAAERDIDSVGDSLARLNNTKFKNLSDQIGDIQSHLGSLKSTIGDIVAFSLAGFGVGAFAGMIKGSIDAADNLNDLSKTTGIAVANLAGLKLAATQSGGDLDGIAVAINKLSVNMGKDAERFKALGVTAKDPLEAFKQLSNVFSSISDPQLRAALAADALGKSWAGAAPLLAEGGTKIGEMVANGMALSGVTQTMADRADEFNDRLAELSLASDGIKARMATGLLPLLTQLAVDMQGAAKDASALADSFDPLTETFRALLIFGGNVAFTLKGVGAEIGGIAAQMNAISKAHFAFRLGDVKGAVSELRGAFGTGGIGDMMAANAAKARAEFDAWEKKILDVGTAATAAGKAVTGASGGVTALSSSFARDWGALSAVYAKGAISLDQLTKAQAGLLKMQSGKEAGEAAAKAAAFLKLNEDALKKSAEAAKAEAKRLAELAGLSGDFAEKWAGLSAVYAKGKINTEQLTKAQADLLEKQPAMKAAAEAAAKAEQAAAKFTKDYSAGLELLSKAQDKTIEDAIKEAEKNEELARTFGMTKGAIEQLELARLEEQLAQHTSTGLTVDEIAQLEKLIDAKKRSAAAATTLDGLEVAKKAAEDAKAEWKKAADSIENSLTDALMRGFESGKSFGRNLMDTLRNMFKTLILQPTIKGILAPVSGMMGSAFSPGAAAATNSDGSSMAGSVASGLFGAGGTAGSLMAGAGWLTGATTLSGSLAAGASLVGTGTVAGGMAGAGMIVGALAPIALGIAAAVAIWKKLDTSGTYHTGGAASASSSGVNTIRAEALGFEATRTNADTEKMVIGLASGIVGILDSTALAFGKTAGYTAATAFADDTSKDGAWGALLIGKLGEKIIDWQDTKSGNWAPKVFADGAAGQTQYLTALSASVRTALDGIGLPSWAQTMLDGLGAAPAIEDIAKVVDSINVTQRALVVVGERMTGFANLSDDTASALIKASGGIDALANSASAYYDIFYDEGEKAAATTKRVTDALASVGLAMPSTREGFRAQVEAQLALGAAGAPAVAALLGVAGTFAQLNPVLAATTAAAHNAADILSERIDLQKQLDQLTMTSADLLAQQRGALDESNRALFDQVQVAQTAKVAADGLASVNRDYQLQIDALVTASLPLAYQRAREVAGMDASTLALHAQLGALQAAAEATAMKTAADKAAADALASTNLGYQTQIDALVKAGLTLADQRALEVAGMDASTLALYERLEALKGDAAASTAYAALVESNRARADGVYSKSVSDRQAAESAAATKAQALLSQRAGMETTLFNLTHTSVEQLARARGIELASMDATLRPLQSQIFAMQDQASAAAQAATALDNAAASARAIAGERGGLQREMLQLQGDTVALRKLEIAALDPSNRALKESIFALQDKMAADQAAAQAQATAAATAQQIAQAQMQAAEEQKRAAEEQKRAAEQLKSAWGSVTDTIFDEVARIRGLMSGGGAESLTVAQTKFAIATAQARAGDMDVTKMLPQLSQTMLQLAETNAVTAFDLRLIRAQTASSLQMTAGFLSKQFGLAVPSYDVGTDFVPRTGLALIHEGEKITPAAYNNPYTPPRESGAALLAEVRLLRAEVAELRRTNSNENYAIAKSAGETASVLEAAVNGEVPMLVKVAV
ncbi:MAG: hypothetical protein Q8R69_07760 [Telluria sp.]|nr:hypothetical protein [Telluria sp.]